MNERFWLTVVVAAIWTAKTVLSVSSLQCNRPTQVYDAATNGLIGLLADLSQERTRDVLGEGIAEPLRASVGKPIQAFLIRPDSLRHYTNGTPVSTMLEEMNTWYCPVSMHGTNIAVLVVAKQGDAYKAVSLGYALLARTLTEVMRAWPEEKGYTIRLVLLPPLSSYFFWVPQCGESNLTPLIFNKSARGQNGTVPDIYSTLKPLDATATSLRTALDSAKAEAVAKPIRRAK